eukprot:RCo052100
MAGRALSARGNSVVIELQAVVLLLLSLFHAAVAEESPFAGTSPGSPSLGPHHAPYFLPLSSGTVVSALEARPDERQFSADDFVWHRRAQNRSLTSRSQQATEDGGPQPLLVLVKRGHQTTGLLREIRDSVEESARHTVTSLAPGVIALQGRRSGTEKALRELRSSGRVLGVVALPPEDKYAPEGKRRAAGGREPSALLVHLVPHEKPRSPEVLQKIATELQALLSLRSMDSRVSVRSSGRAPVLRVQCASPTSEAKAVLSHSPEVMWLEAEARMTTHTKFARGVVESGMAFVEPFSEMGLDGSEEVVGVSDTGMDYDHCFFYDPNRAVPLKHTDMGHRKIVRYDMLGGDSGAVADVAEGHGTHVL